MNHDPRVTPEVVARVDELAAYVRQQLGRPSELAWELERLAAKVRAAHEGATP